MSSRKVISLTDVRYAAARPTLPVGQQAPTGHLIDTLLRPLRDLRISVTDRCNFRCSYCMPKAVFDNRYEFLPQSALMSFEEVARLARVFVQHGVQKVRLTGGEPLLRKNLETLVGMLSALRTSQGQAVDLTLTTNASLLVKKAQSLRDAGLQRITVSLDALDDAVFRRMNDVDFPVADVLRGIDAAERAGFASIKVNMVVKRGVNDGEILAMAAHFRQRNIVLRFIEYMDVGATNGWRMDDVLPSTDVIARINARYPLQPLEAHVKGETAQRFRYRDGAGEIGVIASVTQAFCRDCNRARLSTEGRLFLCLFANHSHDLRALLRTGANDLDIAAAIGLVWQQRSDRYSELRAAGGETQPAGAEPKRVEMHYIGG